MREEAQAAVRAVEEATGISVLVIDDPSLGAMATIKPARADAPAHVLRYNPKFAALADYLIAFQCGFALRVFLAPDTSRFDLGETEKGRQTAGRLLKEHLNKNGIQLPLQTVTGLRDKLFDGLMVQLRSMPIGLRVDAWVRQQYPGLNEQQEDAARRQLAENQGALSPQSKRFAATIIYDASLSMSAAFAAFWERMLTDPTIVTLRSYCAWSRGVDTLLPRTQLVMFVTDDGLAAAGEWDHVAAVVGDLMAEDDAYYPTRYRVRAFPNVEQLAEIGTLEL